MRAKRPDCPQCPASPSRRHPVFPRSLADDAGSDGTPTTPALLPPRGTAARPDLYSLISSRHARYLVRGLPTWPTELVPAPSCCLARSPARVLKVPNCMPTTLVQVPYYLHSKMRTHPRLFLGSHTQLSPRGYRCLFFSRPFTLPADLVHRSNWEGATSRSASSVREPTLQTPSTNPLPVIDCPRSR